MADSNMPEIERTSLLLANALMQAVMVHTPPFTEKFIEMQGESTKLLAESLCDFARAAIEEYS